MMSELVWRQDRWYLWQLLQAHPDWSTKQLATAVGRSCAWVSCWRDRLAGVDPTDETAVHGRSRARHNPPPRLHPDVIARILVLRDGPYPAIVGVPGPQRILKWLHQDKVMLAAGHRLPRSTRTVWLILRQHGRIPQPPPPPVYRKVYWPPYYSDPSAPWPLPTQTSPLPLPTPTRPISHLLSLAYILCYFLAAPKPPKPRPLLQVAATQKRRPWPIPSAAWLAAIRPFSVATTRSTKPQNSHKQLIPPCLPAIMAPIPTP